jgi:hypothetical protein
MTGTASGTSKSSDCRLHFREDEPRAEICNIERGQPANIDHG